MKLLTMQVIGVCLLFIFVAIGCAPEGVPRSTPPAPERARIEEQPVLAPCTCWYVTPGTPNFPDGYGWCECGDNVNTAPNLPPGVQPQKIFEGALTEQ